MTPAPQPVLDDIEARPASATSLLRTVIGLYLRPLGGRISSAALVSLAGDLGIGEAPARTAITRIKQRGLLLAGPDRSYELNPAAVGMLERGDRRIFEVHTMSMDEPWLLVSATIPETRRDLRNRLRRRLLFLGAGSVAPGLWILPGHLEGEIEHLLTEVGAREYATLFVTSEPRPPGSFAEAAQAWWDLSTLRAEHLRFLDSARELRHAEPFAGYVRLVDSWRILPYSDPGLPRELLPDDWPGFESAQVFRSLSARFAEAALQHVLQIAGL